jgi:hypothetical protein
LRELSQLSAALSIKIVRTMSGQRGSIGMAQQRQLLHNNVRLKIDDCLEDFKVEPMAGTEPGGLGPLLRLIGSSADPTRDAALAIRTDAKSAIYLAAQIKSNWRAIRGGSCRRASHREHKRNSARHIAEIRGRLADDPGVMLDRRTLGLLFFGPRGKAAWGPPEAPADRTRPRRP